MQLTITLDKEEQAHFRALAARLDMPPELAGKYLLKAAVAALETEHQFLWPLYLTQAGTVATDAAPLLIRA